MTKKKLSAQGGKKSPLLIILILLVVVAICSAAGYAWFEFKKLQSQITDIKGVDKVAVKKEKVLPVYANLDDFTVSLKPDSHGDDRVLFIGLTLKLEDNDSKTILDENLPDIRSRLLVLFSQQSAEDLISDEAKEKLAAKIKAVVSDTLSPDQRVKVKSVLFNAFILR